MSRFTDYDDWDDEYSALHYGRWEHNARVALKGKRGRQALRDLREALMALPEHRLIEGAMCTVGGVDKHLPAVPDSEVEHHYTELVRLGTDPGHARVSADYLRRQRDEERERLAASIEKNGGEGVCGVAAYIWHKQVKAGADPQEAFDRLPLVFSGSDDCGDGLDETAEAGEKAGLTFTLAWELAYRNDEKFRSCTPEERWEKFVAWIDGELAAEAATA